MSRVARSTWAAASVDQAWMRPGGSAGQCAAAAAAATRSSPQNSRSATSTAGRRSAPRAQGTSRRGQGDVTHGVGGGAQTLRQGEPGGASGLGQALGVVQREASTEGQAGGGQDERAAAPLLGGQGGSAHRRDGGRARLGDGPGEGHAQRCGPAPGASGVDTAAGRYSVNNPATVVENSATCCTRRPAASGTRTHTVTCALWTSNAPGRSTTVSI